MFYISPLEYRFELSQKVKRLSDFKGIDGKQYIVRKKVNIERFDSFPIYKCRAGKLWKTNGQILCGLFNL
jgi:hypothetical protein